jgi:hypothetical protein
MNATPYLDTTNHSSDLRELSNAEIAEIGAAGSYEDFPVIPR